jgi:hypothetical protein
MLGPVRHTDKGGAVITLVLPAGAHAGAA